MIFGEKIMLRVERGLIMVVLCNKTIFQFRNLEVSTFIYAMNLFGNEQRGRNFLCFLSFRIGANMRI